MKEKIVKFTKYIFHFKTKRKSNYTILLLLLLILFIIEINLFYYSTYNNKLSEPIII